MSAFLAGCIVGVSARYAAQIRELLYSQTMKRMAAEQEAARAEAAAASRAARAEAYAKLHEPKEPVKIDVKVETPTAELAEPVRMPAAQEAPPVEPHAQFVDELA
jgi:hypothetical protein